MLAHVRWSVAVAFLVAGGGPLLAADVGPIKKAMKDVEGTWRAVPAEADGKKAPEKVLKELWALTLKGNKWELRLMIQHSLAGTYKIVALEKGVQKVDLTALQAEDLELPKLPIRQIVKLEGDTLTVCMAAPGKARPRKFAAGPGTEHLLVVYKREKR